MAFPLRRDQWLNGINGSIYYPQGDVGIGPLPNPTVALDVYRTWGRHLPARIYSLSDLNGAVLELRNDQANPNYTGAINFNDSGGYNGQLGYSPSSGMTFRSGGYEVMRITTGGLVEISHDHARLSA